MQRAGRRRSGRPAYTQGAPAAAAAPPPPKEEPSSQLHDEADLISFRADTLARFISNQELMENVTSKYVHTLKIEPPASFPKVIDDYDATKLDEAFFGTLEAMRKRVKLDQEGIDKINNLSTETGFDKIYKFQQTAIKKLSALQANLISKEVLERLNEVSNEVRSGLEEHGQTFKELPKYITKSIKFTDISVTKAPEDYDLHNLLLLQSEVAPALPVITNTNTTTNINNPSHVGEPEVGNDHEHSAEIHGNEGNQLNNKEEEGEAETILNNQTSNGQGNEVHNGISGEEDSDMKQFSAMDFMSFDRPADQAQSHNAAGSFMMAESKVDDLHGLFDGGEMEGNDMDNMDNLINFQDEEGEFGHDFLSQIDHSIE